MANAKKSILSFENLGSFGIDSQLQYVKSKSAFDLVPVITEERISTLKRERPNLKAGYSANSVVHNYGVYINTKYDHLFRWIVNEGGWPWSSPPHFVGTNDDFSKVLTTPYDSREWTGYATLYKGTIYFRCFAFGDGSSCKEHYTSAGYCNKSLKRVLQGVLTRDALENVYVVQQTKVGDNELMLFTDVLGRKSCNDGTLSLLDVQPYYSPMFICEHDRLRWWARAILGNIEQLVVGGRSIFDRLEEIEILNVVDMPVTVWKTCEPDVCCHYLDYVLKYLLKTVTRDDPGVVYVIQKERNSKHDLKMQKITSQEFKVVPRWFVELNDRKAKDGLNLQGSSNEDESSLQGRSNDT